MKKKSVKTKKQLRDEAYQAAREQLKYDPDNTAVEFQNYSSDMAYFGEFAMQAHRLALAAYNERKRVYGALYIDKDFVTEVMEDHTDGKKPTKDQLDSAIRNSDEYREAVSREEKAEEEKGRWGYVMKAFEAKRSTLIDGGANIRQQRQQSPRINEEEEY